MPFRWTELHPLVVHFPVALLMVVPLFVILAAAWRRHTWPLSVAALLLLLLGTVGSYVGGSTGEAAAEHLVVPDRARAVLDRHEQLADRSQLAFTILLLAYAAIVFVPRWRGKPLSGRAALIACAAFLALYAVGAILLADAAHQGGRLVHEFGVRSPMSPSPGQ